MKLKTMNKITIALSAGVLATVGLLPTARAELVYEPEISPNAPTQQRADDRADTRQALQASERMQSTVQAQPMQTAIVPVAVQVQPQIQVQPQVQLAPPAPPAPQMAQEAQPEVQSLSKTELMRRERTREELKNEDILQERLEELRLRDEKRRTDQLLGSTSQDPNAPAAPIAGLANQAPQSEVVVSPVTARPGEAAPQVAPIPTSAQAQQYSGAPATYTPAAQQQMMGASAATAVAAPSDEDKPNQFYIGAHGGISSLNLGSNMYGLSATGLYSLGVAGGVMISDYMALEVGYTYNEYGISMGQAYTVPGLTQYSYNLNQNVIDANLKVYVLGKDSKIRPFVIGGGGYSISSLTYPNQLTGSPYGGQLANQSYSSNAFLGEIGVGLELRVSKSILIGASYKFNGVLSSNNTNNNIMLYNGANATQALTGASLQQSSFSTVQAGVSFQL